MPCDDLKPLQPLCGVEILCGVSPSLEKRKVETREDESIGRNENMSQFQVTHL